MRNPFRRVFLLGAVLSTASSAFSVTSTALAAGLFVFSSENPSQDTALVNALTSAGHSVTLGQSAGTFTSATSLAGYDVVFFQANYNWASLSGSGDMPLDGQESLLNFVEAGGGLITTEWLLWNTGAGGRFSVLKDAFPVVPTSTFRNATTVTYSEVTPDSVLNSGLPSSFSFNADNLSGTETFFQPRTGATVYYGSDYEGGAGVVGGNYGSGRVLSFSTVVGLNAVTDPNHALLIGNAASWASQVSPVPEPEHYAAFAGLGLAIFGFWRRSRR